MRILVTGGTGFIGSHTCVALLAEGHEVVVLDNLSNSQEKVAEQVGKIAGRRVTFVLGDVRDTDFLARVLSEHAIDAVIHFAGLKAVGESVAQALRY